jgi:hypothetical protein
MLVFGIALLFAGYGVGSYGYVLVKGWDITLREWFSPLNPYQWPQNSDPPSVPQGQVWPGGQTAGNAGPPFKTGGKVVPVAGSGVGKGGPSAGGAG